MTREAIQRQLEIIEAATKDATRSKEAARRFLIDAGIIVEDRVVEDKAKKPAKKKK